MRYARFAEELATGRITEGEISMSAEIMKGGLRAKTHIQQLIKHQTALINDMADRNDRTRLTSSAISRDVAHEIRFQLQQCSKDVR